MWITSHIASLNSAGCYSGRVLFWVLLQTSVKHLMVPTPPCKHYVLVSLPIQCSQMDLLGRFQIRTAALGNSVPDRSGITLKWEAKEEQHDSFVINIFF